MVENFGDYLRTLRNEKKLSLREVERQSGVSSSYATPYTWCGYHETTSTDL